jgi:hypothetical protein
MESYNRRHNELTKMKLDVLDTIANPMSIVEGYKGELLAFKETESEKYLVTIYKELSEDGFVITSFLTRRINNLNRRKQVWPV